MQISCKGKTAVTLAILVALGGMFLFFKRNPERPANPPPGALQKPKPASTQHFSRRSMRAGKENAAASESIDGSANPLALPREKIEEYLKRHHRDAASLLAAYQASFGSEHEQGDINYLKEAATNYPNDPHVQWTVLAHDAFPGNRRQWLDAFKASSPSNSLANYLSAADLFKNNRPEAALQELMEASGKTQFADFTMESYSGGADISRFGGASPLIANTAAKSAMAGDLTPELANTKGIAYGVLDMQKQFCRSRS